MKNIGFIGFGEAAYNISKGLKDEGYTSIKAYDKNWNIRPQSELIQKNAEDAGIELVASLEKLISDSDFIISAVSANLSIHLAKESKPFLTGKQVFVDMNAASPMTKEKVASIISPGALFVDCAIMGPVPTYKHKVPISASGDGANVFAKTLTPFGMDIKQIKGPAASASASKMFRSIFMKGFVMLILEMLDAAHKYEVEDDVLFSIEKTLSSSSILEVINGLVGRGVIHSERREHEMDEVLETLKQLDVNCIMSVASKRKLNWCTQLGLKEYFKGVPPKDFHEIFFALDKARSEKTDHGENSI